MTHWYEPPEDVCFECGKPLTDPAHLRPCPSTWSFGPGFAFCQEAKGHDGPHRMRNWDGRIIIGTDEELKHVK